MIEIILSLIDKIGLIFAHILLVFICLGLVTIICLGFIRTINEIIYLFNLLR